MPDHRRRRMLAILLAFGLAGCTGDNQGEPHALPQQTSPERSPEISDITDDPFSDASYVGRTVTVSGKVTRVITATSFILTGDEYDDDSILVLSAPHTHVERGQTVTVTGTVQRFGFTGEDRYNLDEDGRYAEFRGEQFLVAKGAAVPGTPSARPS